MTHTTESIIEALRAGAWAAEIKLMDIAADRLEELQRDVNRLRRITTRPEPSRLEIAAMFMAGSWAGNDSSLLYDEAWEMAGGLIATAREAK